MSKTKRLPKNDAFDDEPLANKERLRSQSIADAENADDPRAKLGDNYGPVLRGYLEEMKENWEQKREINAAQRRIRLKAKKDGFHAKALDSAFREFIKDPVVRAEELQRQRDMFEALGFYDAPDVGAPTPFGGKAA